MDSETEAVVVNLHSNRRRRQEKKRRRKRYWVHNVSRKRSVFGEFSTLFPDLLEDDAKMFQYLRMSHEKFGYLLHLLAPELTRKNARFRSAIGLKERLSLCHRMGRWERPRPLQQNYR
jgi:hypothetical protein